MCAECSHTVVATAVAAPFLLVWLKTAWARLFPKVAR